MYRIAICDDEKSTCAEIESYILMYSKLRFIRNEIEVFYSGEAFCEYVKQGNFFDLLFLDIELPAINGIEVVIIITHRLDTISDVDKIFVMSEGRICEEGQHNELMKKGEKYYALVQNL